MTRKLGVAGLMLALLGLVGMAHAQSPYRVEYFNNANTSGAPDATLRLDNDGAAAGANLCADVFIFDSNEEMSECCSCLETPDGLRTLSVDSDLTANPVNGVILTTGMIKVIAAAPTSDKCPPPSTILLVPDGEIQAWATHIQSTTNALTETASQASSLGTSEQKRLAQQCGAIRAVGSGKGICTCGTNTGS
ncbi:MAG: hypothetical protein ABR880_12515 [Candidatus Sulfotelmatobacter sp.]|jgi:hypothetical protein